MDSDRIEGATKEFAGKAESVVGDIASEAKTQVLHRSAYQEIDQQALYRALVKWSARVERTLSSNIAV